MEIGAARNEKKETKFKEWEAKKLKEIEVPITKINIPFQNIIIHHEFIRTRKRKQQLMQRQA